MASSEKTRTVFVPEGFSDFTCEHCGQCCFLPRPLEISSAKYKPLVRLLNDHEFQYPTRDAVSRDEYDLDGPATLAMVGEQCVFLTDQGGCHLCELGAPELRPTWCITFPVAPLTTPRGVNYNISFACPQTAKMLKAKAPLDILVMQIEGPPLPGAQRPYSSRHRIPVAAGLPKLDWPAFRLTEGLLLAVARDWKIKTTDRLVLMPIMLDYLLRDDGGSHSGDRLRERVRSVGEHIGELLATAQAVPGDAIAHYEMLSGLLSRRIGLRNKSPLRQAVDAAMRKVREHRSQSSPVEMGDALQQLYSRHYKPRASRLEHVLGNYIICRLFASTEMLSGGVYKGVYVVAYLTALIRFFATTTAAQQDRAVNLEDMLDAVVTVEKVFSQGRNTFDFLDGDAEQQRMLDPAYAAAIARL
jgi:hypothetical protein